ncbi:hypothetical protein [Acetonema longum]|uniref:Virion structural protein n=1 Tax=Acetonema longum DSM 6540 TaxID=1009370 RepID=F7NID3_9FIRM|nr:hypothetical protein [Acetonema longum]EGO64163.1 hypothetical protein ALO_09179 [Acetonema longum DSM 6540]
MAYVTGTATSPADLLDKIRIFSLANGWTVNLWGDEGIGKRLHLQKGTQYVNLRAAIGESIFPQMLAGSATTAKFGIGINGSTGYDPSYAWHSQPGACVDVLDRPTGASIQLHNLEPIEYHLFGFTAPDFIFCAATYGAVQASASQNTYQHLAFGELQKVGIWTGGAFVAASKPSYYMADGLEASQTRLFSQEKYSSMFVRADIDAFSRIWLGNAETQTGAEYGNTGKKVYSMVKGHASGITNYALPTLDFFQSKGPTQQGLACNVMNAISVMFPIYLFAQRDPNAENMFSTIGTVPNVYFCNIKHLTPGGTYRLNYVDGNEYKVFPFGKKGSALGYDGIAVRYIP